AFEAFGYKQLVFEPFFRGGLVTAMAVHLVFFLGPWPLLIGMAVVLLVSAVGGLLIFGPRGRGEYAGRAAGDPPYTPSLQSDCTPPARHAHGSHLQPHVCAVLHARTGRLELRDPLPRIVEPVAQHGQLEPDR